jgi:hypothetical protein
VAVARPEAFRWFVALAPGSYTATLGFIMLAMGLALQLRDFAALLRDRPLAVRDRTRIPCCSSISLSSRPVQCNLKGGFCCCRFCSGVPRSTP